MPPAVSTPYQVCHTARRTDTHTRCQRSATQQLTPLRKARGTRDGADLDLPSGGADGEIRNDSGGWFHPVHVHLLHAGFGMVLIDRNGVPIKKTDQEWGWKETITDNRNNDSVRALMQWPDVPVNPNNAEVSAAPARPFTFFERRYVFHCHNVDHEDRDMMAQLRVDSAVDAGGYSKG